jgi:ankyrin repeat protein
LGGWLEGVEYLFYKGIIFGDKNIYVNSPSTTTQMTALHGAAAMGHASIVDFLVEAAGANPLALDRNGLPPLLTACVTGKLAIVTYLLSLRTEGCPIDIDGTDYSGRSVLVLAIQGGYTALAYYLLAQGASKACLRGLVDPATGSVTDDVLRRAPARFSELK